MCPKSIGKLFAPDMPSKRALAPAMIPSGANAEAEAAARMEAALRRRRAGAAANILTGPTGIPARAVTSDLGGVAQ